MSTRRNRLPETAQESDDVRRWKKCLQKNNKRHCKTTRLLAPLRILKVTRINYIYFFFFVNFFSAQKVIEVVRTWNLQWNANNIAHESIVIFVMIDTVGFLHPCVPYARMYDGVRRTVSLNNSKRRIYRFRENTTAVIYARRVVKKSKKKKKSKEKKAKKK